MRKSSLEIKFLLGLIYLCFFMALLSFLSGIDDEFCQMFLLYLLRYYFLFITLVEKSIYVICLSVYLSIYHSSGALGSNSVSQNLYVKTLIFREKVLGGGAFGRHLGDEGGALINGISALGKENSESLRPLSLLSTLKIQPKR